MTSYIHGLAAKQFQNGGLQSRFFRDEFLQDSGHSRGSNFGECIGEDKKLTFLNITSFRGMSWTVRVPYL